MACYFPLFSSGLLHFSQILCSLAASLQHECGHSLPCAIARSQQLLVSFWHFSQSLCSLCALTQHSWSHSFPFALALTQQLWPAKAVLTLMKTARAKEHPVSVFDCFILPFKFILIANLISTISPRYPATGDSLWIFFDICMEFWTCREFIRFRAS